ncbi:MAG TPA: protein kinase [Polyangia bacterium]|nr:protein kinase [Polyangia bacterium]
MAAPEVAGYKLGGLLGQGGFGAVFNAERLSDHRQVALKIARPDNAIAGLSLQREIAALSTLGPPAVPAVYESGTLADGASFVAMELIAAPTLSQKMAAADGPMHIADLQRLALQILAPIEAAHRQGLVHCDLKPENIFVCGDLGTRLFDFGLVRVAGVAQADTIEEEAPAGTPEYMSPEQCEGRPEIDARSDVYALGSILYELLSGAPPFWGNAAEVKQSHRSRRPTALGRRVTTISAPVEDVVMRCLAKDPDRRYANASELAAALRAAFTSAAPDQQTPMWRPAEESGKVRTGDAASVPGKPAGPVRQRQAVALVFCECKGGVGAVREVMTSMGAHLAHTAGTQIVLAFGHELGDNPTRSASNAATLLVARGICARALVDLATVSIQARPDGSRRYQSVLFAKKDSYPQAADPGGVLLSAAAAEVLPELPVDPVPGRGGLSLVRRVNQLSEHTTTRVNVAPLIGRDELLRELLVTARAVADHAGPTITTLIGEVGFGKTHLAQTLAQIVESTARMETVFMRTKEPLGGVPEQTTRELLMRLLDLPEEAPGDFARAKLAARLGPEVAREVWAGVAVTMGWAQPDHPEIRELAAAPGALRSAAARAVGESMRRSSRARPLALVIDDAQFAGETALDAIEYATLKEAGCPIWVCVIGRPSFGRGRTAWASRAARRQELTLPALEPAAAAELARRLLSPAENVPASALDKLTDRTQCVPMLLVELVRGLKRDGLVRKAERGSTWYLATDELERLPDLPLVQWLSSRETASLPPDLLAHARLAAILGVELSAEELEGVQEELDRGGVSPEFQLDASIGLRRLTESGILVRHRAGRLGFRHSLLRDTVYQAVPPAERDAIHRAAYEYYRRQDHLPDHQRLPRMAFHAERSGHREEAGRLYLDLANRALARHAYLDAELLFRNASENLPDGDDAGHIAASQGRGLMRFRLGRHEGALKDLDLALARARKTDARRAQIDILLDIGIVVDWMFDVPRSAAAVDEAAALAATLATPPELEARLLMGRGRSLVRQEKTRDAVALFQSAVDLAEKLDAKGYESYAQGLSMLAWCLAIIGSYEESERAFARCITVTEEHGDMISLAAALVNRCSLSFVINNVDRVLSDYKRTIQIAREHGLAIVECLTVRDLGEIYLLIGRPEEAEPLAQRSIELSVQTYGEGVSRVFNAQLLLARLKWYQGDVESARELATRIIQGQTEAEAAGKSDSLLTSEERIMLEMVSTALRGAPDADFDTLVEKGRRQTMQPMDIVEIMEWKALSALRAGRADDGVRFLEEALASADRNAKLMLSRIRAQLAQASARAAS